ncbi:MAG: hypothetical protein ACI4QB_08060, partial [Eubacteriales bacterium]
MQKEWDSPVFATNIESRFENDTPRQPDSCGFRIRRGERESTGEKESSESFFYLHETGRASVLCQQTSAARKNLTSC